jgi:hypothetical protein
MRDRVFVIAASLSGIDSLSRLVGQLPGDFPAPCHGATRGLVQSRHVAAHPQQSGTIACGASKERRVDRARTHLCRAARSPHAGAEGLHPTARMRISPGRPLIRF